MILADLFKLADLDESNKLDAIIISFIIVVVNGMGLFSYKA